MASKKEKYPVLPLRDIVVYPKMIVPLFVGREKSIRALQEVVDNDKNIVLATQKNAAVEEPVPDDIYHIGTLGTILQLLKLPDGTVKVLIEGLERVKIEKFEKEGIVMVATAPLMPEVKLGAYTGLTVERGKEKVKKSEVEEELKKVAERQARFVESTDEAKLGDFATIDFVGSVDGQIFDGGSAQGYRLELGSHSFIDTFEDQIVGMKVGDEKDVNVTFPENYHEKSLAGKPAVFKVTVQKLEKKEIPEINDEFAANVSEFENLEDYKKDIEKRLKEKLERDKERKVENDLIDQVVKGSEVEIPEILVERQLDIFMKDLEMRLSYQGIKLEEYLDYVGSNVEDLRKERAEQAKETVKTRLVLEALVKKENMVVTEAELDKVLAETAEKYKKSVEDYKKSLDNRTIAYYQNDILMKKLLDFLKTNNNII